MERIVAFPEGMESIATTDKNAKPAFIVKENLTADEAVTLCKRLHWRIAKYGEQFELYIESMER